jgi:GNAT superfamily N-acetyltransferase
MTVTAIHPLTPDRWDDFAQLFETDSMCRMCWCVAFRLPPKVRMPMKGDLRKKHFRRVVEKGPPPGLLAYNDAGEAVGWLAIASRPDQPEFNIGRKASAVVDEADAFDPKVWAATCFFVRKDARGEGVTGALLEAGEVWAARNGATRLEACPMAHDVKRSTPGMFVGPKRVFDRAGFDVVVERKPGRPLVRKQLGSPKKSVSKKVAAKKVPARKSAS